MNCASVVFCQATCSASSSVMVRLNNAHPMTTPAILGSWDSIETSSRLRTVPLEITGQSNSVAICVVLAMLLSGSSS